MHAEYDARVRVNALVEALPYVQRWAGRTVVVKFGGSAMVRPALLEALVDDLVLLREEAFAEVAAEEAGSAGDENNRLAHAGLQAAHRPQRRIPKRRKPPGRPAASFNPEDR